jgi:hypothetical protein
VLDEVLNEQKQAGTDLGVTRVVCGLSQEGIKQMSLVVNDLVTEIFKEVYSTTLFSLHPTKDIVPNYIVADISVTRRT